MKRAEWTKDMIVNSNESPLGTPQFSVSKGSSFRYGGENPSTNIDQLLLDEPSSHQESFIPAYKIYEKSNKKLNLVQSADKNSEITKEIMNIREYFEESITKVRKQYLQKERKIFELIKNEDELHVLIATRPEILEIRTKISPSPIRSPEPRFIDDYRSTFSQKLRGSKLLLKESGDSSRSINADSLNISSKFLKSNTLDEDALKEYLLNKEHEIRQKLELHYNRLKNESIEIRNNQINEAILEIEVELENYWKEKISELKENLKDEENSLQDTNGLEDETQEKIKKNYEERRKKFIEELRNDIDAKIKAQYLQRKSKIAVPKLSKKERENKIMKLQTEIEISQANIFSKEREY